MGAVSAAAPFTVLIVCRANLCRSPLIEHLLIERCRTSELNWSVSSAGLQAQPGLPMHQHASRLLADRRVQTAEWRSRQVSDDMLAAADLVLTADANQRGAVARLRPDALSRAFTLLQLAHLMRAVRPHLAPPAADRGSWLLSAAAWARPHVQPLPREEVALADPLGQPYRRFEECATTIDRSLRAILRPKPANLETARAGLE